MRAERPEGYRFETPERVEVAYDLAGPGSRFAAALIDGLLMALLLFVFWLAGVFGLAMIARLQRELGGALLEDDVTTPLIVLVMIGATFLVLWGYHVFFEMVWHGQTPGKRALGLRVIKEGGYPVDLGASVIRNLVRAVDYLPWSYLIGAIVMFVDARSRRLGDMAAGTLVVKERRTLALGALGLDPAMASAAPPDGRRPLPDLSPLTARDQSLLRDYVRRRSSLAPAAASALAGPIAAALAARLGHELGDETPEQFLDRLAGALVRAGAGEGS
jgi:uncharacterized RDD family membrane protein YckC